MRRGSQEKQKQKMTKWRRKRLSDILFFGFDFPALLCVLLRLCGER